MKTILSTLLLAAVFVSCEKKDEEKKFYIDPTALVSIKPAQISVRQSTEHLSAIEIVTQTEGITFYNDSTVIGSTSPYEAGFASRDITSNPPCFKRYATDLINKDAYDNYYMTKDFVYMYDVCYYRLIDGVKDTIAYTPNSVMKKVARDITEALKNNNTDLAYEVFNNAIVFIPITGAEWKELKRQGLN